MSVTLPPAGRLRRKLLSIPKKPLGRVQEGKVTCNEFSQQDYNLRLIVKTSFAQSIQDAESPPRSSFCSVEAKTDGQPARKCLELLVKNEIQSMCWTVTREAKGIAHTRPCLSCSSRRHCGTPQTCSFSLPPSPGPFSSSSPPPCYLSILSSSHHSVQHTHTQNK